MNQSSGGGRCVAILFCFYNNDDANATLYLTVFETR